MADKFLSLELEKQRVLALEVERLASNGGERPVVVTAERGRIAVFCGAADGTWRNFVRAHDPLDRTPRRPANSRQFGWSRRVGVASDDNKLALAYRRRFTDANDNTTNRRELWIDVLSLDPTAETLTGRAAPVLVPRGAFGIDSFGLCVWADRLDNRLLVVAQAFFTAAGSGPELVLLTAPFPQDDGASLASAANWTLTTLDSGGWDFDARREGRRLFVVHRRIPAAYATDINLPIDPLFGLRPIVLSENPAQATHLLSDIAVGSLVLVEASLPDGTVRTTEDTGLFGELPQIHRTDPMVITMQRLRSVRVSLIGDDGLGSPNVNEPIWKTFLVLRISAGWRAASMLSETSGWPCQATDVAEAHLLFTLRFDAPRRARLELATLFSNNPVSLFNFEVVDKAMLLTFAHSDPHFASLRATTFRVSEIDNGNALSVTPDGYTTLDIGHRRLFSPAGDLPAEYLRFKPFALKRKRKHEDGYKLTRQESATGNALAWALAGADDKPHGFYAYADRGDGGGRVYYDRKLSPLPPTADPDDKAFAISSIPEPAQAGSAWVRLETPSFVDTNLAGYLVPQKTPSPSLGGDIERKLDLLPAVAFFTISGLAREQSTLIGGGELNFRPGTTVNIGNIESILLNRATADRIESDAAGIQGDSIESDSEQQFQIELRVSPKVPVATTPITFSARAIGVASDVVTFTWTFSDGTAPATGASFVGTFAPTKHDASVPGAVVPDGAPLTVTLTATTANPDDATQMLTSTVSTTIALPASLWAALWEGFGPFRHAPDDVVAPGEDPIAGRSPGFFAREVVVDVLKYRIAYRTTSSGAGATLQVTYNTSHTGRFRFVGPTEPGQGDTEYQLPIDVSLSGLKLSGDFGSFLASLVKVDSVKAKLLCSQRFQACVQTSERRGSTAETDTVIASPGRDTVMLPSALCCVPVGEIDIAVAEPPEVTASLTKAARDLTILVAALVAAGFVALVFAVLLPIFLFISPATALTSSISAAISAIVSAIVFALLAWLATVLLEFFVVRPLIVSAITDALNGAEVRDGFEKGGVMKFAGEGLAEALAVHLITQAISDGHAVAPAALNGLDRFRPQFFEIIAVEAGRCKAKIRVP